MSEIAVIIVNYQAASLAIEAVESVLARAHGGRSVDVHLVDNASPSGDAAELSAAVGARGWGVRVTLYLEAENHGFGRGNNLVLEKLAARDTPPDMVFLLNPDARLDNEAIAELADYLDANPAIGCAGARIALPDGTPVTSAFRFPGIISEFSAALAFGPVAALTKGWEVPREPLLPTGPTDWVAGAAVMFRLEALREVGFFDPAYFLYYEEVDLMRALQHAGWQTAHVAEACVVHVEGASTDVKSGRPERRRRPAYLYESWRIYFGKNHGRLYALMVLVAWITGAALNHVWSFLRRKEPAAPLDFFPDVLRHALRPLLSKASAPPVAPQALSAEGHPVNQGADNRNPSDIGFWALVGEDFRTHSSDAFSQGFWALFWHRFGNWRMGIRPRLLRAPMTVMYRVMAKMCEWFCGIMLPYTVLVGRRVRLDHFGGMILVAYRIGDDVVIRQNTTFGIAGVSDLSARPTIENGVDIGAGAVIVGDITIGEHSLIGANAVVTRSMPARSVIGGVPAKVLRMRDE